MSISWLHISDLHVYDNSYYQMIKSAYEDLARRVKLDFIVVTGDYCHFKNHPQYDKALKFLNYLVALFGVSKNDVFLVPGNHDVRDNLPLRKECISRMNETIDKDPDAYMKYMSNDANDFRNAFHEYNQFVRDFYEYQIAEDDDRITSPSDVIAFTWKNKLNIIMLNTALVSKNKKGEIFDIKRFLKLKTNLDLHIPGIVLAHHSLEDLVDVQKKIATRFFKQINVRAYLCGDKHVLENGGIICDYKSYPIPMFVCGKSVPETLDSYSDVSLILYRCDESQKVYVHPYEWRMEQPNGYFTLSSKFDVGMDQRMSFDLSDNMETHSDDHFVPENEIEIGNVLSLGFINKCPVKWKILDKTTDKLLLLSTEALAYKCFCDNIAVEIPTTSWESCSLNKWLNGEFLDSLFGCKIADNQKIINNNCTAFPCKNFVVENAFLLSADEFDKYIKNDFCLQRVKLHDSITNDGIYHVNGYVQWLLRTGEGSMIATVLPNGKIDITGTAIDIKHAIRPAMWIKIG